MSYVWGAKSAFSDCLVLLCVHNHPTVVGISVEF